MTQEFPFVNPGKVVLSSYSHANLEIPKSRYVEDVLKNPHRVTTLLKTMHILVYVNANLEIPKSRYIADFLKNPHRVITQLLYAQEVVTYFIL